ncbi:MAG: hypothetical protein ABJE66_39275 [Deltaproteobacteria bacterium]
MKRLGELLVDAGGLDAGELEQALRAQIVWGGRLGTNLIELGFIDLDELSRVLGKQRKMPAALAHHFDKADAKLQHQLPAELADKYLVVPLLHLADGQIALASMDPLDADALAEISAALGVGPQALVCSVAAEQRMRYQLERVYNIKRNARYLRSRGGTIPPFPVFGDFETEPDSEVEIPIEWEDRGEEAEPAGAGEASEPVATETGRIAISRADTDALAAAIEQAAQSAATGASSGAEPAGRDRRQYVRTLGDDDTANAGAPATAPRKRDSTRPKKALGRIAIRKVAITPAGGAAPMASGAPAAAEERDADTLASAARLIRRSPDRDRVAELVIDALVRFAPAAEAGMLFVIRGGSATGWKHYCRTGADQPELAVPMDQPGLVPRAAETGSTVRGLASELGAIDARLLKALGAGGELAVVPIAIAGKVMCLLVVALTAGATLGPVETVATSAGTAFARLMRDAGR